MILKKVFTQHPPQDSLSLLEGHLPGGAIEAKKRATLSILRAGLPRAQGLQGGRPEKAQGPERTRKDVIKREVATLGIQRC